MVNCTVYVVIYVAVDVHIDGLRQGVRASIVSVEFLLALQRVRDVLERRLDVRATLLVGLKGHHGLLLLKLSFTHLNVVALSRGE